jgi:beta-galactosidase
MVAVKPRANVVEVPGEIVTDFYVLNEKNLTGPHTLTMTAKDPSGREVFRQTANVEVRGGDVFSQLAAEGVRVPFAKVAGMYRIEASLADAQGKEQARGFCEALAVDWKSGQLPPNGAVFEEGTRVQAFLKKGKNLEAAAYDDTQGKLDWIMVARPPNDMPQVIPPEYFTSAEGQTAGIACTVFNQRDTKQEARRIDKNVAFRCADGSTPDPGLPLTEYYGVRWEGWLKPPVTGSYAFQIQHDGRAKLWIDNQPVLDHAGAKNAPKDEQIALRLEAGKTVAIRFEYFHNRKDASAEVRWAIPQSKALNAARLFERVRQDGTTLILADYLDTWKPLLAEHAGLKMGESFEIGIDWVGGQYFVKEHPLFKSLPVNQALNWPYEQVVKKGRARYGIQMEGEELVAGCYRTWPFFLGTSVGVVPLGKGRIILSTLDIVPNLDVENGPASVARKLLCNYLEYAGPARPLKAAGAKADAQ